MSTSICRWLFLLFFLTTLAVVTHSKDIRVVCYYTNWSAYRPGTAKFVPQNINPYLCTHLIYAFGGFTKENTLKPFDKYADIEKGGYAKFTGLKTFNKNLKTMLAIGGWNEGSSRFSPMVASADRRKELVKNAIKFLRQNHFDGLDLDWEYPNFRDGGKPRDRDNYAQLVQELREEFDRESEKTGRPRLLLTMAVPAGIEYINKGYDVPKLNKYLDWMNILNYDYHSAYEPSVNHHSPLYSLEEPSEYNYDADLNIDYTIQHYLKEGADPQKLVMGIPTYGRSYTLFNPEANDLGAPADGPGDMGEATRENGFLSYYEICERVKSEGWEVVQPNPDAMGPYAFKDQQWVAYDDEDIARKKSKYVAENNLGGIMFWSIDNDDFRGSCHGKAYPIIEAAKEALILALGSTDDNLVAPPSKRLKTKPRSRPLSPRPKTEDKAQEEAPRTLSTSRRRNRIKAKEETTTSRAKPRRKETRRTTESSIGSSLELVTPSYTTPAPPSTPEQGGGFKCEDEGFYPHPKDCKKYFWCLSGPGELGIVAHAFTCPAGLYFNKAADSCDYTRNVLCNTKKATKPVTTTTTPPSTTSTKSTASTARVPPKITAATSRTTVFRTSTTTEAYDDEYEEYEDEEDSGKNAEEDPRVIKELLDLIKKAGGIEELEKQLKVQESGTGSSDSTTPSSISKSLVQKVLAKTAAKNAAKKSYNTINRNSRGPQNEGLSSNRNEEKEKRERSRPQYTNIARQRQQKTNEEENEEEDDDDNNDQIEPKQKSTTARSTPGYVNIRRGRVSTTAAPEKETSKPQVNRNKILGEEAEEDDDDDEEEEENSSKKSVPQYVNIRRQKPSTTEASTTTSTRYSVIRRGSTTTDANLENTSTKTRGTTLPTESKYKTIRRSTTTPSSVRDKEEEPSIDLRYNIEERGTTIKSLGTSGNTRTTTHSVSEASSSTKRFSTTTDVASVDPESSTNSETDAPITNDFITTPQSSNLKSSASLSSSSIAFDQSTNVHNLLNEDVVPTLKHPQLLEPRPFSLSTTSGPSKPVTETSTRVTKVSDSNYKQRVRQRVPPSDSVSTTKLTTDKPTTLHSRAPSRFKLTNNLEHPTTSKTTSSRSRARFSTTTTSSNEDEINRTYRPTEIEDFSSLTAFDFSGSRLKDRDFNFGSSSRSRRPILSTTAEPTEHLKADIKSRKYVDTTTFGKSRRPGKIEDQAKSETQKIRGVARSTAEPSSTESSNHSPIRGRKVIRRFRPTEGPNTNGKAVSENLIENASTNPVFSRQYSRYSSTTHRSSSLNNIVVNESEDISAEEDENINLSESNIRENSNVNNNNALLEENKAVRRRVLKRVKSKVGEEEVKVQMMEEPSKPSTEPNVIVRTRKIIRKLKPTEASHVESDQTTQSSYESNAFNGRKRKVIRRFRPTTEHLNQLQTPEPKTVLIQGRAFASNTTTKDEEEINTFAPTTETNQDSEETTTDNDIFTTTSVPEEETTLITTTTTVRSYINPILTRQKNRPVFVRPQVGSSTPQSTVFSATRPKSKTFSRQQSRARTSTTERIEEIRATNEKKFVPRGRYRFNKIESTSSSTTTESSSSLSTSATTFASGTELDVEVTTIIDVTTAPAEPETSLPFDESTELISTVVPEIVVNKTIDELISKTAADNLTLFKDLLHSVEIDLTTTSKDDLSTIQDDNLEQISTTVLSSTEPEIDTTTVNTPLPIAKSTTTRTVPLKKPRIKFTKPSSTTQNPLKLRPSPLFKNRIYSKPSTTKKPQLDDSSEEADDSTEEEHKPRIYSPKTPKPRVVNRPSFRKTTETPSSNEEVPTIDTQAVKIRNKNLFSKKRKMNTPAPVASTLTITTEEPTTSFQDTSSTILPITESVTKPTTLNQDTTETLTTLHHIFAEPDKLATTPPSTTKTEDKTSQVGPKIVEKLIEVNRIVEVHGLNRTQVEEDSKTIDKIGVINRVKSVQVVDGSPNPDENEIGETSTARLGDALIGQEIATVREITNEELKRLYPNSYQGREERKFEIYSKSKVDYSSNKGEDKYAEIIDGRSHINVVTPRPFYNTEASTIALQGLFHTDAQQEDELLETENSRYVDIRILNQEARGNKEMKDDSEIVPIKVLKQDDYITMKAEVVEVTPKAKDDFIKIVPIRVEMSRKLLTVL